MTEERDAPADHAGVAFHPPVLLALAIVLGFVGRRLLPLPFLPESLPLVLGPFVFVVSWVLFFWSAATMMRGKASIPTNEPTRVIVTAGPYRFSRNPIYLAMVLLLLALGLWLNGLWFIGLAVVSAGLLWWGVISREERYLADKFGEEYEDYKTRVRRWI